MGWKNKGNAQIKSENHLALAYKAILPSGAHNSVSFQSI